MARSTSLQVPALNRYALYKSGTATLLNWLIFTAAYCGHGDPKNPPKNPVPVSRLLRCARAISKRNPAVNIPGNIIELIVDVIQGRELYAELYIGTDEESTKTHRHFIDVLWDVVTILRDVKKRYREVNPREKRNFSGESGTSTDSTLSSEQDGVANMFTHLSVDEPSVKPFSTPEKSSGNKNPPSPSVLATTPEEERKWALFCYLEDMYELRKYIRELWEAYKAGELSMDVVGVTTELAFGCMRRAEDDLDNVLEALGGNDKLVRFSFLHCGLMLRDSDLEHRVAILCPVAVPLARTATNECKRISQSKPGAKYVPSESAVAISETGLFAKNLMSIIPDIVRLSDMNGEFVTQFCPWYGEYTTNICTVMMVQSYMDIYDTIGDPTLITPGILNATYARIKQSTNRTLLVRSRVRNIIPFADMWLFEDKLSQTRDFLDALRKSDHAPASDLKSEARIFKALPVAAAERIKYLKWYASMIGSRAANDAWVVIGISYIWRAAQHYGMVSEKWEDLEWLIALQSKNRPYLVEVAEHGDPGAFGRHFQIAFGTGTGNITAQKASKAVEKMRKIESMLEYPALMELEAQSQDNLGHERGEMAEVVIRKMTSAKHFGKNNKRVKKEDEARFTNIELLETFKDIFIADEPEYNFDMLSFWTSLAELMQSMNNFLYPRLMNREPMGIVDAEVVRPLLDEAAYHKQHGLPMEKTQIAVAARMIEKHVQSRGGALLKEAMAKSSGHITEEENSGGGEFKVGCAEGCRRARDGQWEGLG